MADSDSLGDLWRSDSSAQGGPSGPEVLDQIRQRARQMNRSVLVRNLCEGSAAVLLLGIFVWTAWQAPGVAPKLGSAAAVSGLLLVLGRLLMERERHPAVRQDLPALQWLVAEQARVEAEVRLLRSVVSWYVLPLAVGGTIWCLTTVAAGLAEARISPNRTALALTLIAAICGLIFGLVGWLVQRAHRWAIERGLEPYATDLRSLRASMEAADTD